MKNRKKTPIVNIKEGIYTPEQATEDNEQGEELARRFGNKYYNELGARVWAMQRKAGTKIGQMNSEALQLAKQVIREMFIEWSTGKESIKGWWIEKPTS